MGCDGAVAMACREAFDVVKDVLARAIPECQCFLMGSFPLRTYLPDSDIDIAVLVPDSPTTQSDTQTTLRKILDALYCAAMQPEPQEAGHTLRNISFVNAKTPVVRCTVGNVDFDVTVNQIGSLGAITFLEEADRFIGKQHLFKRSLLLLKLWLSTEAVTYAGRPLLGAKNGMFSSYAVSVMVLYLFNAKRDDSLNHPFEVLRAFLETYSRFPWDSCVLTLQGAAPIQIGKTVAKPVDMPASVENRFRPLLERFQNMQPEPLPERDDVSRPPPGSQFRLRVCNIQDPLNADNNLTPTVTKSTLLVIKSGLQNAYTHLHHVCMSLGVTIPVPPAPFAPQAATTAPQLVMLPARPASAAAAHSHVPPHHPSSAAFARGIAMPFVMHGANGQAQQLQQLQQQQQQQQQAALSGQVQPPMLPIGASQPSLQATAAANTSSAVPPISYRRTSSESPEPPLQRSKYSTSHEALQRCWALRSFFPHSFQLYIISGPKRPDLLDHPFQALQVTPPVRPRGSFDWSHLEPAKLEGDIESMWFALIQASRIASEWGSGASQIVSPREGINMLTSSPTSAAHFSPTLWQNQSGPALRAVDLFDLDGTSTCSGHSPLTSSSDVAVQSSGATDAEDTEDIEDAEDHRAPEPPRTEDKCTQTAAIAEDVLLRLPAEETATATATTTATARTPSPPPPPIREPAPGPPALVDPSPKPKKRRNNKRSKSPGRTASLSELQHNGTTVNAKAEAVEHITAAHCAIASPAAVQGVHLPSASSAFQSHLFTMVWSCMVCILLMHFRLLEFSSQPPAGAQNGRLAFAGLSASRCGM